MSTPGIDRASMNDYMEAQRKAGGLLNLFNMFSGGALDQMSIFALGIMPYVSASIIMQLLAVVVPSLERLQKEGAAGRQKLNQYTRYGSILLSIVQVRVSLDFCIRSVVELGRTKGAAGFAEWWFPTA